MQRAKRTRSKATKPAKASNGRRRPVNQKLSLDRICVCKPKKDKIKRPDNAWIVYRTMHNVSAKRELGSKKMQDISKHLGEKWNALSKEQKAPYVAIYERSREEHARMYPHYKYTPNAKNIADFGDETCTCGAYQANLAHRAMRDAEIAAAGGGHPLTPTNYTGTGMVEEPDELPDYDPDAISEDDPTPVATGGKRKRNSQPAGIAPAPKRATRSASKNVTYEEYSESEVTEQGGDLMTLPIRQPDMVAMPAWQLFQNSNQNAYPAFQRGRCSS